MRGDLPVSPVNMEDIWRSGDWVGPERRAFARVTVQRPQMRLDTFDMQSTFLRVPVWTTNDASSFNPYPQGIDPTKGEPVTNTYADYLFTAPAAPLELPNVASVSWTRTIDAAVAEATIEFWNTSPLPLGEAPENGDLDRPGFYSYGRGTAAFSSRWGHEPNEWQNMLMPDNLLRVWEGYGFDATVPPEEDPHLVLTGVWMIDEVRLSSAGTLVCTCRDLGRLLMDHQNFLPVVPEGFYPTAFKAWDESVTVASQRLVESVERLSASPIGSGNDLWPESSYVGARVYGHSHTDAFDNNPATYWLSVGNASSGYRSAYEYVDFSVGGATVSQVRFTTVGDQYNAYISVKVGGSWVSGPVMGYHRDGRGHYEEGVPYIASVGGLSGEGEHTIAFAPIAGVTQVRLWLGNLRDFGLPGQKYRAGLREVSAYGPVSRIVVDSNQVALTPGPAGSNPGTCRDFSNIVELFCAWAGFYWPSDGYLWHVDGTQHALVPAKFDTEVLGAVVQGRVWGDILATGTAPPEEITASAFDKKSLADGIQYLADTVGFVFFVDETGAAQWRLPNVWGLGNWVGGMAEQPGRTNQVLVLDERQVLIGLDATIQSRNVREGVFVANVSGKMAAMVGGYNPNPTGLRRVGGFSDQHFTSAEEARVMADLIAVRQLFKYRQDQVVIPGFPGVQIDDQVRIFERVTSEGFVHYVMGIQSSNDLKSGEWRYTLQTHWLGDDPEGAWVLDKSTLNSTTIKYVDALQVGPEWSRAGLSI